MPSQDLKCRTAERFVFCYFFFGLAVFSLASHHRGDLIFPLLPAASLMAGNMAAQRFQFSTARSFLLPAAAFAGMALVATGAYYYLFRSHDAHVLATCRLRDAAKRILRSGAVVAFDVLDDDQAAAIARIELAHACAALLDRHAPQQPDSQPAPNTSPTRGAGSKRGWVQAARLRDGLAR